MTKLANKSLTTKTLEGFSWTYISIFSQAILQLVTLAILARKLGPKEFGVLSLAIIFTTFVERVGFLGIGPALVQKSEINEIEIRGAFTLSILVGTIIAVFLFLIAPEISLFMKEPELTIVLKSLSVICIIESASQVIEHMLQRELRFKSMLISGNFAYAVGNGLIGITLAFLEYGVWSLVFGTITTRLIKLIAFYLLRPIKPILTIPFVEMRVLIISGLGFAGSRFFSYVALVSDNFIVGKMLGSVALGMYGRAYQIMTLPSTYLGQVLEKVLFPAMAKKQGETENLTKIYLLTIQLSALIGIPFSIFSYNASHEIVLFLFGEKWTEIVPTLKILSLGVFFRLAYKNSDTLIRSVGAVYAHTFRQIAYTAIVLFGSIFGVRFGIDGVAYAVLLAVFVNYLMLTELGLKILKLNWKNFIISHAHGLWIGFWMVFLSPIFFSYLRGINLSPFFILILSGLFEASVFIVFLKFCPKVFRAGVLGWIVEKFHFEKKGRLGRMLKFALSPHYS